MNIVKKIALIVELVVGFGFAFYLWALGLLMSPMILVIAFTEFDIGSFILLAALIFGGAGIWGLVQLFRKILDPNSEIAAPKKIVAYLACGISSLLLAATIVGGFSFIFILPIIVTLHLCYMGRSYLGLQS